MIFEYYFYAFYSRGNWVRATAVVVLSVEGILLSLFEVLKHYQILDLYHNKLLLNVTSLLTVLTVLLFSFRYKGKDKLALDSFTNHPIDSKLNRSLCWIIAALCVLIPMALAIIFKDDIRLS